jgi:hypothetical protein
MRRRKKELVVEMNRDLFGWLSVMVTILLVSGCVRYHDRYVVEWLPGVSYVMSDVDLVAVEGGQDCNEWQYNEFLSPEEKQILHACVRLQLEDRKVFVILSERDWERI